MAWNMTVHKLADKEMRTFKSEHPRAFKALVRAMTLLSKEENPMNPDHPDLQICPLRGRLAGWFRLRVKGQAQWRVGIRFLQSEGNSVWQICMEHEIDNTCKQYIQITHIGHRSTVYQTMKGKMDKVAGLL